MSDSPLVRALGDTLQPLAAARTLPRAAFTDQRVAALEGRELFGSCWLAVAREEDFPRAGSFRTRAIGSERALIVRGEDAKLRAFFNVCRHRGSRLIEDDEGELRGAIACPYHAWTYGLDGRLRRAPRLPAVRGDADALALVPMPLAMREGFVFVRLDGEAQGAGPLGDLPDLSRFRLSSLWRAARLDYEVAANWKIVCENYSECYHCPAVHPQLNRLADLESGGFEAGAGFNGGPMRLRAGFETLSTSGRRAGAPLADAGGEDAGLVHYYLVYPNLMLGIHPDYVATHTVWPLAADRSHIACELLFAPEASDDPGFDASEVSAFWDLTNRQDWLLCERVQRGAGSCGYVPGPYHPSERCVHAFDRWYAGWLLPRAGAL